MAAGRRAPTSGVRDLLTHASGLPAHLPLYERHSGADAMVAAIAAVPLVAPPRTSAIYSDLGFIVLGRALERVAGEPLDAQATTLLAGVTDGATDVRFASCRQLAVRHRTQCVARPFADRRGARRQRGRDGRCRRARRPVRECARRRRPRASRVAWAARRGHRPGAVVGDPGLRAPLAGAGLVACAGLGHGAADVVVRPIPVAARHRPHGVHGHVALDRSRAGSLRRAAHQPRRRPRHRCGHGGASDADVHDLARRRVDSDRGMRDAGAPRPHHRVPVHGVRGARAEHRRPSVRRCPSSRQSPASTCPRSASCTARCLAASCCRRSPRRCCWSAPAHAW